MVDGTGLENRHTRKGIGGSNPSLSARILSKSVLSEVPRCARDFGARLRRRAIASSIPDLAESGNRSKDILVQKVVAEFAFWVVSPT